MNVKEHSNSSYFSRRLDSFNKGEAYNDPSEEKTKQQLPSDGAQITNTIGFVKPQRTSAAEQ